MRTHLKIIVLLALVSLASAVVRKAQLTVRVDEQQKEANDLTWRDLRKYDSKEVADVCAEKEYQQTIVDRQQDLSKFLEGEGSEKTLLDGLNAINKAIELLEGSRDRIHKFLLNNSGEQQSFIQDNSSSPSHISEIISGINGLLSPNVLAQVNDELAESDNEQKAEEIDQKFQKIINLLTKIKQESSDLASAKEEWKDIINDLKQNSQAVKERLNNCQ